MEGFELNRILSCIVCPAAAERSNAGIPSVVCRHTAEGMLFFVPRFVSRQMRRGVRGGSGQDGFDGQFALAPAEEGIEQAQAREVRQGGGGETGVGREHAGR